MIKLAWYDDTRIFDRPPSSSIVFAGNPLREAGGDGATPTQLFSKATAVFAPVMAIISPLAPLSSPSPNGSQSSSFCPNQKAILTTYPQSHCQPELRGPRHSSEQSRKRKATIRSTRAISISSTEQDENAPIVVDIDDSTSGICMKGSPLSLGATRGSIKSEFDRDDMKVTFASQEDGEETSLGIAGSRNHPRTVQAPISGSPPCTQSQKTPGRLASNNPENISGTRFRSTATISAMALPHCERYSIKSEPVTQPRAQEGLVKLEPGIDARDRQIRVASLESLVHTTPELVRRAAPIDKEPGPSRLTRPIKQSSGTAKGKEKRRKIPAVTDRDSIVFSEDDEKTKQRKKKFVQRQGQAKAAPKNRKTPKPANKAKVERQPRALSPKKARDSKKEAKGMLCDLSRIPNPLFRGLNSCPLCRTHSFGVKQEPPTRRRHVSLCASVQSLTCEDVETALQQENNCLDQLERERLVQEEAAQTAYIRIVEASGLGIQNAQDDGYWQMLGLAANDPRRRARCKITLAQLGEWSQGRNDATRPKKRKLAVIEESSLRSHAAVRMEVEREARELLGDFDALNSPEPDSADAEIDQDTGDITMEMLEPTFHFPADQRLAEERFTQFVLPMSSLEDSEAQGTPWPSATQMPSSTFVQRSSSKLAKSRPHIRGANEGLKALFMELKARADEHDRRQVEQDAGKKAKGLERARKDAEDRAMLLQKRKADPEQEQRRLESLRKQNALREKLAAEERAEKQWKESGLSWLEWRVQQIEEAERREKAEHDRLIREDQGGREGQFGELHHQHLPSQSRQQLQDHPWPTFEQEDEAIEKGEAGVVGEKDSSVELEEQHDDLWWLERSDADDQQQPSGGQMFDEEDQELEEDDEVYGGPNQAREASNSKTSAASEQGSSRRRSRDLWWNEADEDLEEPSDSEEGVEAASLVVGSQCSGHWKPFNSYDFAHEYQEVVPTSAS